jgi:Protein of unknown function (DUF2510)
VSAQAGWYPDPGGGRGLYRYWDGKAWSAATSPNPSASPPSPLLGAPSTPGQGDAGQGAYGSRPLGAGSAQPNPYGQQAYGAGAYANFQSVQKKRSPIGWWIAGAALVIVIVVVAVIAIRALTGGGTIPGIPGGGGQPTSEVCPKPSSASPEETATHPNDGRVHGGPVSFPELAAPWEAPRGDERVPFGRDVLEQTVTIEPNYQPNSNWVASILVGELQAGDGFFTPEQGSHIVVKCILGAFYGDNPVKSDVKVNKATTIDGHEGWVVESQLSYDIPGLKAKGELLIVAIVAAKDSSGLYYASIPNNAPELVAPARESLAQLKVDG